MHHCLDREGQEEYEAFPEVRAQIIDRLMAKKPAIKALTDNDLYKVFKSCRVEVNGKDTIMPSRDLPSINAFPDFDLKKESKMFLTMLEPPNKEKVLKVKNLIKSLLVKYGPKTLSVPSDESALSLGPSKYSDGHVVKSDFEKPSHTWSSSWDYQKFKTDPRTEREVWLPPKGYKGVSSWWHFFTEPLTRRIPWIVKSDDVNQVCQDLFKRWKPSKKMDLKGCGLQFPREYIVCAMQAISEMYPNETVSDYMRSATKMFSKLSVKMGEHEFMMPKRGVGLGYFSNLMTLVVASLLQECDITYMFNDDILCPSENYDKAISLLTDFDFVINDKKSGQEWFIAPFFAGVTMTRRGFALYYSAQGKKAAIFNKKYHFERKQLMLSSHFTSRWKANYHYERIFGFEVSKGEAFKHPTMLGLDPEAVRYSGYVKGGILRRYQTQRPDCDEEQRRIWSVAYPWKDPPGKKGDFQKERYNLRAKKNIVTYTGYDEYLHPQITERMENLPRARLTEVAKYSLPSWADLQSVVQSHFTCGRTTYGRSPLKAASRMLSFLHSQNPIHSWVTGGYNIETPFYRIPGVDPWNQLLYESLIRTAIHNRPLINKEEGEGSLVYMTKGSGIDFLKNNKEDGEEFILDIGNSPDEALFINDEEDELSAEMSDLEVDIPECAFDNSDDESSSNNEDDFDFED
jgi:hypothetical protein